MKKLIVAIAALGLTTGAALAQTPDFASVDTDGNGMVSMEEGAAAGMEWSEDDFKAADTDGDGSLSAEEYATATAG